jgi:hypothetical protein
MKTPITSTDILMTASYSRRCVGDAKTVCQVYAQADTPLGLLHVDIEIDYVRIMTGRKAASGYDYLSQPLSKTSCSGLATKHNVIAARS